MLLNIGMSYTAGNLLTSTFQCPEVRNCVIEYLLPASLSSNEGNQNDSNHKWSPKCSRKLNNNLLGKRNEDVHQIETALSENEPGSLNHRLLVEFVLGLAHVAYPVIHI